MAGEPELLSSTERETGKAGALPRVVVVVRELSPGALSGAADEPPFDYSDQPTTRIRKEPRRTAEDERLICALVPLDMNASPGLMSDYLGRSLLFRVARVASLVKAPRLILFGEISAEEKARVYDEAYRGFGGGPVEILQDDPSRGDLGARGRILVLDPIALHDPTAIKRLAQVEGDKTSLLLTRYGDGHQVRTDNGRIVEMGINLDTPDGRMAGACSAPLEHWEAISGVGARAALEALGAENQLVATLAPSSYGQQLHDGLSLQHSQEYFFDRLASSGTEGVFDEVVGRPISRHATLFLLHKAQVTPNLVSVASGLLAILGAFVLALAGAWGALAASLALVASAILDRVDGELARLRMDDDDRPLDFGLDHLTHMAVFLALAWHVFQSGDLGQLFRRLAFLQEAFTPYGINSLALGFAAAAGVLLMGAVLWWRGPPNREPQPLLTRLGDLLATSFGSRDYFYLFFFVAAVNVALPGSGLMALFLVVTTLLINLIWIGVLVLTVASPRRGEA